MKNSINPHGILQLLGYDIDEKGRITEGLNQLAVISLENTGDGGVLRVHGSREEFFYTGDELMNELDLALPIKVTKQHVYFQSVDDDYRLKINEFTDNALRALSIYNRLTKKDMAG